MTTITPISEAKVHLSALVESLRDSSEERVVLLKHGKPAAVMLSAEAYNALVEALDDAEDRLAFHEVDPDDESVDFDKALELLGGH